MTLGRWSGGRRLRVALVALSAVVVAGCSASAPGTTGAVRGTPDPSPSAVVASPAPSPLAAGDSTTAGATSSVGPGGSAVAAAPSLVVAPPSGTGSAGLSGPATASGAGSSPASPVASASGPQAVVDATLLSVLPASIAGLPVTEFPDAEHQAITDPNLGRNVSRVATAFVGDPAGANWAYAAVVDVRLEARTDAFYRDWQESFDASACERAGGVTGHTTVIIAGHDVERTACGAGVRTYHVKINGTGLLVSISDLGAAHFAQQVIAGLQP